MSSSDSKEPDFKIRSRDRAVPIEEYSRLPRHPITVVLDNLRSGFNVGAIFRSCECARIEQLITCGITAHPPAEQVMKTSMGTAEFVAHSHRPTTLDAVTDLKSKGIPVLGLETTTKSHRLHDFKFPQPCALVFGNEALGIEVDLLARCDEIIEIPTYGYKNSLNVASAVSIVLFEILRQWEV